MSVFQQLRTLASLAVLLTGFAAQAAPPVITMDGAYLDLAKQRVAAQDPVLQPAYARLLLDAEATLKVPAEAVTNKKLLPPSKDKHDYMSLAPYWWPDPSLSLIHI